MSKFYDNFDLFSDVLGFVSYVYDLRKQGGAKGLSEEAIRAWQSNLQRQEE